MRVREIIHRDGPRLRLTLTPCASEEGAIIRLSDPHRGNAPAILLDLYGIELLAGFLMSARLARAGGLADEHCNGDCPFVLRVTAGEGDWQVEIDQLGHRLRLAAKLWDRLYAELQMALAHGRHLGRGQQGTEFAAAEGRRLLH